MGFLRKHPEAELIFYVDGTLSADERKGVEEHVASCADCRDQIAFIRDFNAGIAGLPKGALTISEACPNFETLVAYEAGELDEETARRLRGHLALCDRCAEAFYALQRARPPFIDVVLRKAGGVIHRLRRPRENFADPVPVVATERARGEPAYTAPFRATEKLLDPDTGAPSTITLRIEDAPEADKIRVIVETDEGEPIPDNWKVGLLLDEGRRRSEVLFSRRQLELKPALPYGFHTVELLKGEEVLGRITFSIEAFNLPDALEAATENLDKRDYGRAMAILEDAAKRHRESRDAWDLRCLALALAAGDEEVKRQPQRVAMRSTDNIREEAQNVLKETRKRFGDDLASSITAAVLNPSSPTQDLVSRLAVEIVSVTTLPIMKLISERTATVNKDVTDVFVETVPRLERLEATMAGVLDSINAIRGDLQRDVEEKASAIALILDERIREIAEQVRLPDSRPFMRDALGERCWDWLGEDVQKWLAEGESIYRICLRSIDESPDFAPPLLEYGRAYELLLNTKIGGHCAEIRDTIAGNSVLQDACRSRFPRMKLTTVLRVEVEKDFTLGQIADLLHLGGALGESFSGNFSRSFQSFLQTSRALFTPNFLEVSARIASIYRNGAAHIDPVSPIEIWGLRKCLVGLDEYRVPGDNLFARVRGSPWLTQEERQRAYKEVKTAWRKYPGLVKILWQSLASFG